MLLLLLLLTAEDVEGGYVLEPGYVRCMNWSVALLRLRGLQTVGGRAAAQWNHEIPHLSLSQLSIGEQGLHQLLVGEPG